MNGNKDLLDNIVPKIPERPDFGNDIAKTTVGENPETDKSRPLPQEGDDE